MPPRLSARQEQCVRLTAFRTDKEIAAHLGISEATVKKHIHEACQRLGVNRRKAALAILEQNGPGYPNDPIAKPPRPRPDTRLEGDRRHGNIRGTASALELGRSGDGARPSERVEARPSAARASAAPAEGGLSWSLAGGFADSPAQRGDPGLADPVHGYRAPPRGSLFRLTMVAITAVFISAMLLTAGGLVSDFHHIVDRFDPKSQ
jgi:DNA-binding CsgD family transcriptional regulator